MENQKSKASVLSFLLPILVAAMFALTFIPGVWVLHFNNPGGVPIRLCNFYTFIFPIPALSGILCGASLLPTLASLRNISRKGLTFAGVLLESAALLSVALPVYEILFHLIRHQKLSLQNMESTVYVGIYFVGVLAAAIMAFSLCAHSASPEQKPIFSKKQMALYSLAIAAILALCFVRRCWKWSFMDGGPAYESCFEGSLWTWISMFLLAASLNLAMLHSVGAIKSRPVGCAALLLGASVLMTVRILLSFVSSDLIYSYCMPLPLTFVITAAQIVLALRLLSGKRKGLTNTSPQETIAERSVLVDK